MPIEIAGLRLYELKELARVLRVNKITLRGYIEQGRLKAVKVGRSYRITEEDLKEFLLMRGRGVNKREEKILLKEIPKGHLGAIQEDRLSRQSLYEDRLMTNKERGM